MIEAEWLTATDPLVRWDCLSGKMSDRKHTLFACACCRRVWHELIDERSRRAVIVAEHHLDGLATQEELEKASKAAYEVWEEEGGQALPASLL